MILILISAVLLNSCEQQSDSENSVYPEYESAETIQTEAVEDSSEETAIPLNSTAATYEHPDKKFVKTADLSMEVDNVYASTNRIENKVSELGGYVAKSDLSSGVFSEKTYPVSKDSAIEVRKYNVRNQMSLRIPEHQLSEFLISLGDEIRFLNFRNIQADEATLELLLSQMEQQRIKTTTGQLDQLTTKKAKIGDKQNVITDSDRKKSELNHQKINQLKIDDKIAYSTVSLIISEKMKISETTVINLKEFDDKYKAGFLTSAAKSIKGGFELLQSIVLALLYLWPVILLAILIYFGIGQNRKKRKVVSE